MRKLVCIALGIVLVASVVAWAGFEELASLNVARGGQAAVVVDGVLYVIGGEYDGDGQAPVERYDADANTWTIIGDSCANAYGANTGVLDGVVYVMGGVDVEEDSIYEGGGYMWDTRASATPVWVATPGGGPSMGHGDSPGPTMVGTKIYLISGEDNDIDNAWPDYVLATDIYDVVTGEWTLGASIDPYQREDQGVAAIGSKIIMMGGEYQDAPALMMNIYDTQLDTWTHITDYFFGWEKIRLIANGEYLYVATGDGAEPNQVYRITLSALDEEPEQIGRIPLRLAEAAVAILDGEIVIVGGEESRSEEVCGNVYILHED